METPLEHVLTHCYKEEMISYMHAHPEAFKEVIELAVSDKQPHSWRAAWLLWSCMEKNDQRIQGNISKLIKVVPTKQDGHQRELLKILLLMDIHEEQEGHLYSLCVSLWEKTNKKPSVRFIGFKFILKIINKHPELTNEISFLTQDHYMESLSPGVRKSVYKLVKTFHRKRSV